MSEPTAALTFQDLILEIAIKLGFAHYGENGDEAAQIPTNAHDLDICERHANNAIRMFIADAPPTGWRWARPVASVILWPAISTDDDITVTGVYDPATKTTVITASEAMFYASMEGKTITITDVDDLTILTYTSSTVITVDGNHHWTGSKTFSIDADGNYTLPATFGGQYTGQITFEAGTNIGSGIIWTSESDIRRSRESSTVETGDPRKAAVQPMEGNERRWELVVYPTLNAERTVEFQYELYFNNLVNLTDKHPAGFSHDEVVKAACHAVLERDSEDTMGGLMQYYRQVALPNSYRADARSYPRRLGGVGRRPTVNEIRRSLERPTVTYST